MVYPKFQLFTQLCSYNNCSRNGSLSDVHLDWENKWMLHVLYIMYKMSRCDHYMEPNQSIGLNFDI